MKWATPEAWKVVDGYNGHYEVSSLGNVRSLARTKVAGRGGVQDVPGRTLKQCAVGAGYKAVNLCLEGVAALHKVHRLVASAFVPGSGATVNHKDGDKSNNAHSNLEWCSVAENIDHAFATGLRSSTGERNPKAVLVAADVLRIRELCAAGKSRTEVASMFGVNPACISKIMTGRTWRHV